MKKVVFMPLIVLILAFISACSAYFVPFNKFDRNDPLVDFDISDPESEGASDEITISSVTPNSGLIDGDSYTFTIDVTYKLASLEDGADIITFTVEQAARDWGDEGDLSVAATLSSAVYDEEEGYSYNGIITDYQVLSFE